VSGLTIIARMYPEDRFSNDNIRDLSTNGVIKIRCEGRHIYRDQDRRDSFT